MPFSNNHLEALKKNKVSYLQAVGRARPARSSLGSRARPGAPLLSGSSVGASGDTGSPLVSEPETGEQEFKAAAVMLYRQQVCRQRSRRHRLNALSWELAFGDSPQEREADIKLQRLCFESSTENGISGPDELTPHTCGPGEMDVSTLPRNRTNKNKSSVSHLQRGLPWTFLSFEKHTDF